jgi:ribosomal protein L28
MARVCDICEKGKMSGNIKGISDAELMIMGKAIGSTMRRD